MSVTVHLMLSALRFPRRLHTTLLRVQAGPVGAVLCHGFLCCAKPKSLIVLIAIPIPFPVLVVKSIEDSLIRSAEAARLLNSSRDKTREYTTEECMTVEEVKSKTTRLTLQHLKR